jgi:hypothetical protein
MEATEQTKQIPRYRGIAEASPHIEELAKTFSEVAIIVRRKNQKNMPQFIPQFNNARIPTMQLLDIEAMLASATGGGKYEIDVRDPSGSMQIGQNYLFRILDIEIEGVPIPADASFNPRQPAAASLPFTGHAPLPFAAPVQRQPTPQELAWIEGLPAGDRMSYLRNFMPPPAPPPPQQSQNDAALGVALRQTGDLRGEVERERALATGLRTQLDYEKQQRTTMLEEQRRQHEKDIAQLRREFDDKLAQVKDKHESEVQRLKDKHENEIQRHRDEQRRLEDEKRRTENDALRREIAEAKAAKSDQTESNTMVLFKMLSDQQQQSATQMMTLMSANKPNGVDAMMPVFMKMLDARSPEAQSALLGQMLENQIASIGAMSELMKAHAGEAPPAWLEIAMKGLDSVKSIAAGLMRDQMQGRMQSAQLVQGAATAALPSGQQRVIDVQQAPQQSMFSPNGFEPEPEPQRASVVTPAPAPVATPTNGQNGAAKPVPAPIAPLPPIQLSPEMAARVAMENQVDAMLPMLPVDFATPDWRRILVELHLESDIAADMLCQLVEHELRFGRPLPAALADIADKPRETLEALAPWLPISQTNPDYLAGVIDYVENFFTEEGDDDLGENDVEEGEEESEVVARA